MKIVEFGLALSILAVLLLLIVGIVWSIFANNSRVSQCLMRTGAGIFLAVLFVGGLYHVWTSDTSSEAFEKLAVMAVFMIGGELASRKWRRKT
ncbi:MAG TPA: hypothetical protein VGM05_05565 [Planctomycetaceae bacterium]|jgi:hypothetical protein